MGSFESAEKPLEHMLIERAPEKGALYASESGQNRKEMVQANLLTVPVLELHLREDHTRLVHASGGQRSPKGSP